MNHEDVSLHSRPRCWFVVSAAQAVEIKVLSGNGPRAAVRELCTQFERATGNTIDLRFRGECRVKKKIEAGERFDVVVAQSADHRCA